MPARRIFAILLAAASAALAAPAPKQLTLVKSAVRQYEDGPAIAPGFSFFTGDTVFFSCQIQNYQVSEENRVDLHVRFEATDPGGVPLAEPVERAIATQVSAEDKNWMPIVRETFQIPPLGFPGVYHVRVAVDDRLSKQTAKSDIDVPVRGRRVEPSDKLVARNFRFLRSEEDRNPMESAVYQPGESLWARFEITGFRYGPKNRVQVSYGISVLSAAGDTLFTQPQAAADQDESFYPKRYIPGVLSLSLDPKVKPGEYTLAVTLRDEIGNQTEESRHVFRVE
ncbi:MAG: hypothetical protein ACM336_08370 [Acidobacteriota bacterium]